MGWLVNGITTIWNTLWSALPAVSHTVCKAAEYLNDAAKIGG